MPVQKYERKPLTIEVLVWDGTNNQEFLIFGEGKAELRGETMYFILDKPNHYGYTALPLYRNTSGIQKDSNGKTEAIFKFDFQDYNEIS